MLGILIEIFLTALVVGSWSFLLNFGHVFRKIMTVVHRETDIMVPEVAVDASSDKFRFTL